MGLFGWLTTKVEGKVIQGDVDDALKENPNMTTWLKNHKGPFGAIFVLLAAGLQLCGDPTCAKASVFAGLIAVALVHAGVFPSDEEGKIADLVAAIRPHLPAIQAAAPEAKAILDAILAVTKKAAMVLLALAILDGVAWAMGQWSSNGDQTATSTATTYTIPFPATSIEVCDDDAANSLWARVDGGTASNAGTDSISWFIKKGECHVFGIGTGPGWFGSTSTRTLTVVAPSGLTTVYRAQAIGPNP